MPLLPHSTIAVASSTALIDFYHVGVVLADGLRVVSRRPVRGVVFETIAEFSDGKPILDLGSINIITPEDMALRLVEEMRRPGYSWTTSNCEHFALYINGYKRCSPQAQAGVTAGIGGSLAGLGFAVLLEAFGFKGIGRAGYVLAAAGGGYVAAKGRVACLKTLYRSHGVGVVRRIS